MKIQQALVVLIVNFIFNNSVRKQTQIYGSSKAGFFTLVTHKSNSDHFLMGNLQALSLLCSAHLAPLWIFVRVGQHCPSIPERLSTLGRALIFYSFTLRSNIFLSGWAILECKTVSLNFIIMFVLAVIKNYTNFLKRH